MHATPGSSLIKCGEMSGKVTLAQTDPNGDERLLWVVIQAKIAQLVAYFRPFSNILTALSRVYFLLPINVGPRISRGCF